ncbi:class I SAM-dependent methyltransferase [uncultured Psychroserpens sp.]|uniref:class I SAM-dependent methyltransferase n=1 Tax=uncultured Psychroserpens sp. TaxID=255436 RepID=UPI0026349F5F|nr:class I SAM-dependent methyltransferase [uncultured Psychroserpens sp.]
MTNTREIEKDFIAKRDSYFEDNYIKKTKGNYLRRYRNNLIRNEAEQLKNVQKVLDVGCGPAILYPEVYKRCDEYHALDLVQSNLDKILSENDSSKITVIQSDLDSFKPQGQSYDLVICSGSIEYTENPEKVVDALIKVLKPGGTLIMSFPNKKSPYRIWSESVYKSFNRFRNKLKNKEVRSYKRRLLSEKAIREVLERNTENANPSIKYFGLKLLLQPLDAIFRSLDYTILKYFNEHPSKLLHKLSQEFLVVYSRK